MPKVLHIISGLKVGGAEMMLYRLILSSRDGQYKHLVVSLDSVGEMRRRFEEAGIELFAFDFRNSPIFHFIGLVRLIRRIRPDIVQTWLYHADLIGGLAAHVAGLHKVIWGVRTTDISASGSFNTRMVRWLCSRMSYWIPKKIVCAAEAAKQSHLLLGYDEKKMVVVPNGYDFSRLCATSEARRLLRIQYGIEKTELVIGSLGRFNDIKDQENFVRAAYLLIPKFRNLRFLMVGRGVDWANSKLVSWVNNCGCKDRFILLGEREDVPQCLAAMDIFCLHSRNEAFPNVLVEAMSMGLPCVSTDVGDASIILAGNGVVVPKENPLALAHGIGSLLEMDSVERAALGERGKQHVLAAYSIDRARERFEMLYDQLIQ